MSGWTRSEEATIDDWKAEMAAMTDRELIDSCPDYPCGVCDDGSCEDCAEVSS